MTPPERMELDEAAMEKACDVFFAAEHARASVPLEEPLGAAIRAYLNATRSPATWEDAIEAAAKCADSEEEPAAGEMPPAIIKMVLEQDTVGVETALIAAVRATKKSIASAIRKLTPPAQSVVEE